MLYEIIENALTEQELSIIENDVLSHNYPWFLFPNDTEGGDRFPFMCHTLMTRDPSETPVQGVVNSGSFEFFNTIFRRLTSKSNVLLRAALNLTFHHSSQVGTIHDDHLFPHNNLIVYLSKSNAGTRLYDEDENEIDRIPGNYNTAVKFLSTKHAQEIPAAGEVRLVLVFTYI